jgi:ribonuclease J
MKIHAVGGYNEIGKNMTAVEVGSEVVICDMGIHLEPYIQYTEDEDIQKVDVDDLRRIGALPNDLVLDRIKDKVTAIIPSHAHLDHVGAIVYLSNRYRAPIICSPFTAEVIKAIARDERITLKNEIKSLNPNSRMKVGSIVVEFINMTHSTPHTVMIALHTREGTVLYANDFKFDNHPLIGRRPNYERLEEIGKEGLKCLICDSTRAALPVKTPSEMVAKEMLRDVLEGVDSSGRAIIVTTFSSHLARLKSIIEFGKKLNRKIVFLGRSLAKYTEAGEAVHLVRFSEEVEIVRYRKQILKRLAEIQREGPQKYMLVVTGHQGEPQSTLARMVKGDLKFSFKPEDHVIFSCTIIPTETNIENRRQLEARLHTLGVRVFRDIHVSGHAAKEDLRDLLNMVKPGHLIPAHGDKGMKLSLASLAMEKGYRMGKNIHLLADGDVLDL